jgi:hypothetical protein
MVRTLGSRGWPFVDAEPAKVDVVGSEVSGAESGGIIAKEDVVGSEVSGAESGGIIACDGIGASITG